MSPRTLALLLVSAIILSYVSSMAGSAQPTDRYAEYLDYELRSLLDKLLTDPTYRQYFEKYETISLYTPLDELPGPKRLTLVFSMTITPPLNGKPTVIGVKQNPDYQHPAIISGFFDIHYNRYLFLLYGFAAGHPVVLKAEGFINKIVEIAEISGRIYDVEAGEIRDLRVREGVRVSNILRLYVKGRIAFLDTNFTLVSGGNHLETTVSYDHLGGFSVHMNETLEKSFALSSATNLTRAHRDMFFSMPLYYRGRDVPDKAGYYGFIEEPVRTLYAFILNPNSLVGLISAEGVARKAVCEPTVPPETARTAFNWTHPIAAKPYIDISGPMLEYIQYTGETLKLPAMYTNFIPAECYIGRVIPDDDNVYDPLSKIGDRVNVPIIVAGDYVGDLAIGFTRDGRALIVSPSTFGAKGVLVNTTVPVGDEVFFPDKEHVIIAEGDTYVLYKLAAPITDKDSAIRALTAPPAEIGGLSIPEPVATLKSGGKLLVVSRQGTLHVIDPETAGAAKVDLVDDTVLDASRYGEGLAILAPNRVYLLDSNYTVYEVLETGRNYTWIEGAENGVLLLFEQRDNSTVVDVYMRITSYIEFCGNTECGTIINVKKSYAGEKPINWETETPSAWPEEAESTTSIATHSTTSTPRTEETGEEETTRPTTAAPTQPQRDGTSNKVLLTVAALSLTVVAIAVLIVMRRGA